MLHAGCIVCTAQLIIFLADSGERAEVIREFVSKDTMWMKKSGVFF